MILFINKHRMKRFDKISTSALVSDVDQNDIPLLMSVSTTHTPDISLKLSLYPAKQKWPYQKDRSINHLSFFHLFILEKSGPDSLGSFFYLSRTNFGWKSEHHLIWSLLREMNLKKGFFYTEFRQLMNSIFIQFQYLSHVSSKFFVCSILMYNLTQ